MAPGVCARGWTPRQCAKRLLALGKTGPCSYMSTAAAGRGLVRLSEDSPRQPLAVLRRRRAGLSKRQHVRCAWRWVTLYRTRPQPNDVHWLWKTGTETLQVLMVLDLSHDNDLMMTVVELVVGLHFSALGCSFFACAAVMRLPT